MRSKLASAADTLWSHRYCNRSTFEPCAREAIDVLHRVDNSLRLGADCSFHRRIEPPFVASYVHDTLRKTCPRAGKSVGGASVHVARRREFERSFLLSGRDRDVVD